MGSNTWRWRSSSSSSGGILAELIRTQLTVPNNTFITGSRFNQLFTVHGTVMIFLWIIPAFTGLANYIVPLMIGANDMAFPRLNAFAFWVNVPAALIMLTTIIFDGFGTGWTGYPPLSQKAPLGMDMFFLAVYFAGLSSILGSLNVIATTIRMRAKGMEYFRMPIFVWLWNTSIRLA